MAYINQEQKKEKNLKIKELLKTKYADLKIKHTMGIEHYSTLRFTIVSSTIDFKKLYAEKFENGTTEYDRSNDTDWQINEYYIEDNFTGKVLEMFNDVKNIMMAGNHNNSDSMTDYFDVGWYIAITAGRWNKPYILVK